MSKDNSAVADVMNAFEEFKATNDNRLREIERKGSADTVTETKLAKIEATLAQHEDANQKLTLATKAAEKAQDEVKKLQELFAKLEAKIGRPGFGTGQAPRGRSGAPECRRL